MSVYSETRGKVVRGHEAGVIPGFDYPPAAADPAPGQHPAKGSYLTDPSNTEPGLPDLSADDHLPENGDGRVDLCTGERHW